MNLQFIVQVILFISFIFIFFFHFEVFQCTKCKFVLILSTFFFFKHKLHAGQILNFGRYFPKHLKQTEMTRNFFKVEQEHPGQNSQSCHCLVINFHFDNWKKVAKKVEQYWCFNLQRVVVGREMMASLCENTLSPITTSHIGKL